MSASAKSTDFGPLVQPALKMEQAVGGPDRSSRLVLADNRVALLALRREFAGRFRCVYLDPPFNTGRRYDAYSDCFVSEEWREMMRLRLELIKPLVAEDGAVFAEIDGKELGTLIQLMDDVFGRTQRVSIVTIVRSATTGHKAGNRGPVNVTDYLLVYEKARGRWRYERELRVRNGLDRAYNTFVRDPRSPPSAWTFEPLSRAFAADRGYRSAKETVREMGRAAFDEAIALFALRNAAHVVRFAQPRYEAISRQAQALVDRSRAEPGVVFRLERKGRPDLLLRGGNRVLFLSRKVQETDAGPRMVEPLTNVWDDVPFQGIAREGGVRFSRNKKPERLLQRVLSLSTEPGDWVLDPFLGSGTTAAVAQKMGRYWVGVESSPHASALCLPRLRRVVEGQDASGVTRATAWKGGGGFGVYACTEG